MRCVTCQEEAGKPWWSRLLSHHANVFFLNNWIPEFHCKSPMHWTETRANKLHDRSTWYHSKWLSENYTVSSAGRISKHFWPAFPKTWGIFRERFMVTAIVLQNRERSTAFLCRMRKSFEMCPPSVNYLIAFAPLVKSYEDCGLLEHVMSPSIRDALICVIIDFVWSLVSFLTFVSKQCFAPSLFGFHRCLKYVCSREWYIQSLNLLIGNGRGMNR